jgi:predicted dehydrogenase
MSHRIGLVGCGNWGRHILRDLRELGCEVEVVARSEESIGRARDGGAARVVGAVQELREPAGIVVATPDATHAAVLEPALEFGVPVFCEKPLTVDPASARRLADAAPDRLFVMHKWRDHPGIEALRDLASSQELGPLTGLYCRRVGWGMAHPESDATWHIATHDLSIALEILGRLPEPRAAVAERVGERPTGITALLGDDPWVAIEASSARHERRRQVQALFGEGVAWLAEPYAEAIGVARADALGDEPEWRPISTELPLFRQLRAFVAHLDGGPTPGTSAGDAAEIVAVLARLRELAGLPAAAPEAAG